MTIDQGDLFDVPSNKVIQEHKVSKTAPLQIAADHILHEIEYFESPNRGSGISPKFLVMHFTCMLSAKGVVRHFMNTNSKVSAHLILDRDGTLTQMVPFNMRAQHAGASYWKGHSDLNSKSIGIEIINYGESRMLSPDGKYVLPRKGEEFDVKTWGKIEDWVNIPDEHGRPVWWHKFTAAQYETLDELVPLLVDHYKLREVVGHSDIAIPKGRKNDPGPAFAIDFYRQFADHANAGSAGQYVVITDELNMRGGPGTDFEIIDKLSRGEMVKVLDHDGRWALVEFDRRRGYVHDGFIMKS